MQTALTLYPVRHVCVPTVRRGARRKLRSGGKSFARMLAQLDAASHRLVAARRSR